MRVPTCAAAAAGVLVLTGVSAASVKPEARANAPRPAAPSVESFGVKTTYRAAAGKGYTARERHMADCLATYPGYDPATDRIAVRPGVTRPCELPKSQ